MIVINLDIAISLLLSLIFLLVIGSWLMYTNKEEAEEKKSAHVVQCPYCSFVFLDRLKKEIQVCPRCESYIEKAKGTANESTKKNNA